MPRLVTTALLLLLAAACNDRHVDSQPYDPGDSAGGDPAGDPGAGDPDPGDSDATGCEITGCAHLDTACAVGVCTEAGVCGTQALVATTPCGDSSATDCDLADACDGAGYCSPNIAQDGTPCDECPAGPGNCGGCVSGTCRDRCGNAQVEADAGEECDGGADAACPGRCRADCTCWVRSCADMALLDAEAGDGVVTVEPIEGQPLDVYCDMTTDGGGWTLLATISGGDADSWNAREAPWTDASTIGDPSQPWADFKSPAWSLFDVSSAEVMLQRRHGGATVAQVVLGNECLRGVSRFGDLFTAWDTSLACGPDRIEVLASSPTGVAAGHEEGSGAGLGSALTNGFCWMGQDTADVTFDAHLTWNDVAGADCSQATHAGGVAVSGSSDTAQIADADIAATAWLAGTDPALTDVSIFVREAAGCRADADCAERGEGFLCDLPTGLCYQPGSCDPADPTLAPCLAGTTCEPSMLGGNVCTNCVDDTTCRAGETCLNLGMPDLLPAMCISSDMGGIMP